MRDESLDRLISTCRMIIGTAELLKNQGMTIGKMEDLIIDLKEYLDQDGPKYELLFSDRDNLQWMFYKWCRDIKEKGGPNVAETPINVIAFLDENKLINRPSARRIASYARRSKQYDEAMKKRTAGIRTPEGLEKWEEEK